MKQRITKILFSAVVATAICMIAYGEETVLLREQIVGVQSHDVNYFVSLELCASACSIDEHAPPSPIAPTLTIKVREIASEKVWIFPVGQFKLTGGIRNVGMRDILRCQFDSDSARLTNGKGIDLTIGRDDFNRIEQAIRANAARPALLAEGWKKFVETWSQTLPEKAAGKE